MGIILTYCCLLLPKFTRFFTGNNILISDAEPFDSKADGYCRGEGVGLVFLKKLSEAIKDGDFVLGVVPASGVNQCKNETYITVPHGPSQSQLYNKILKDSGIRPSNM